MEILFWKLNLFFLMNVTDCNVVIIIGRRLVVCDIQYKRFFLCAAFSFSTFKNYAKFKFRFFFCLFIAWYSRKFYIILRACGFHLKKYLFTLCTNQLITSLLYIRVHSTIYRIIIIYSCVHILDSFAAREPSSFLVSNVVHVGGGAAVRVELPRTSFTC